MDTTATVSIVVISFAKKENERFDRNRKVDFERTE